MSRLDRHLLVVAGLVGLTALALAVPRGHARPAPSSSLDAIPRQLGLWADSGLSARDILPIDGRSREWVSRVYASGSRRVWLSVARYTGENGPQSRPSLEALVPTPGATAVARDSVSIALDGAAKLQLATVRVSIRLPDHTVTTWYWYQLGDRIIANEYGLRFWLALQTALRRSEPLLLIRVATVDEDEPTDFIRQLLPRLHDLAAVAGTE
jgi:EpsI family protein